MYQVVLVDDDVYVTAFMEKFIPWEQHGFQVVASFKDSTLAHDYLKENDCDVLITDIGMPQLSGIELISELKDVDVSPYNVILSCHDDFHFAQQALKLDVFEYILKESMEEDKIVEVLERLKITMDQELQSKDHHVKITKFLKQNNMSLKTIFIEELMRDQYIADDKWWNEQESLLDIDFSNEEYTVVLCFIDQYQDAIHHYEKEILLQFSLNNVIEEVLSQFQKDIQIFFLQGKFLLMFPTLDMKELAMKRLVERAMKEMNTKISEFLKISVTSVIGEENRLRESLIESMKLLLDNQEQRFYYQHGSTQNFQPISYTNKPIFQHYMDVVQDLRQMMMNKEEAQIKEYLEDYFEEMKEENYAPAAVKDWAIKLVLDIKVYLNTQADFGDLDFMTMTDQLIKDVETFEHLQSLMTEILLAFMERVELIEATPKNDYVFQVQKYVREHLNEKITLKDVSSILHLNPSYFSRMFKKETGDSFIEFVTRLKMEHAKELLDHSTRTVEEIAMELGFDSKSYFLKTFRKQFDMSPQEYKYKQVAK